MISTDIKTDVKQKIKQLAQQTHDVVSDVYTTSPTLKQLRVFFSSWGSCIL